MQVKDKSLEIGRFDKTEPKRRNMAGTQSNYMKVDNTDLNPDEVTKMMRTHFVIDKSLTGRGVTMIFEEKKIILKDGRVAILKSPCVEDAEKLLNYIKKSCGETDFLAHYPEERNITVEQEEAWVNRLRSAPNTLGITCYIDGEVAGNCEISFRGKMKTSHRAIIAIAILKDYWNLGIGSAMLEELVAAAQKRGIEIMELEFVEGNERAKHLYEKFGFRVVSEKPNAFKFKDGTYLSEVYMQKYL